MKIKIYILFLLVIFSCSFLQGQDILLPHASATKDNSIFANNSKKIAGKGYFPLSYDDIDSSVVKKDTSRSWFARKVLKEHFIQQENDDFYLAIDPLINIHLGKEILQINEGILYQNTRGAQVFGHLKNTVSFYTAFQENQANFVEWQSQYFDSRGEFYPKNTGEYVQSNAVVPNGGRTKPFKDNGYDYTSAISYIRVTPIQQLTFQFGNAPRFYGWGHRSFLLSDNSFNYTHLSIDWKISDKWSYSLMRGKQLNLIRKQYTTFVEKPYERKGIGTHYLSYQPIPSLLFGLFESTIYLRDEAASQQRVNPLFYNPILGVNTLAKGGEGKDIKNLIGINSAWKISPEHMVYGQFVTDDFSNFEHGFQLGYRAGNPFQINNLFFQMEYNQATSSLYAAENERMAYTHFNIPLAHTLGNGFKEFLVRISYQFKGVYLQLSVEHYQSEQPIFMKDQLFLSKNEAVEFSPVTINNIRGEIGYELNPAYHLRIFLAANYRTSVYQEMPDYSVNHGMISAGVKTDLFNQYFDF